MKQILLKMVFYPYEECHATSVMLRSATSVRVRGAAIIYSMSSTMRVRGAERPFEPVLNEQNHVREVIMKLGYSRMAQNMFRNIRKKFRRRRSGTCFHKWDSERLFVSGEEYFEDLLSAIKGAESNIWLETYILKDDEVGRRVLEALDSAGRKGIEVRLVIDGFGSQDWIRKKLSDYKESSIAIRVYHPLPFANLWRRVLQLKIAGLSQLFSGFNRRTHRKLVVIDKKTAYVGSMNICAEPVESIYGSQAWRDTAVAVSGRAISNIVRSFQETWERSRVRFQAEYCYLVRDNRTTLQRFRNHRHLLREIARARERILITTAYFIPERRLQRYLRRAARRGVDVRLIVPACSDVFFLPWVSRLFYLTLKESGVKIYEFQEKMIHSKTMIIDKSAWIGSSNLNGRSLYWDRELDIRVVNPATVRALAAQFEIDQNNTIPYEDGHFGNLAITRWIGYLLLTIMRHL